MVSRRRSHLRILSLAASNRRLRVWEYWAAVAAVVALPLAALSLAIDLNRNRGEEAQTQSDIRAERQRLYIAAMQELRWNDDWLRGVATAAYRNESLPAGEMRTDGLLSALAYEYDRITAQSYGEEQHIYQQGLLLSSIAEELSRIQTPEDARAFEERSGITLHDVMFLNGFLGWYIGVSADDAIDPRLSSLSWSRDSDFDVSGTEPIRMRRFVTERGPITSYSEYLGLLD